MDIEVFLLFTTSMGLSEAVNIFATRAALIASVLLYFPLVLSGDARRCRHGRGEIFTGMVNLHIAVTALATLLIPRYGGEVSPFFVGVGLLMGVLSTATWCLVGFHLCEGRLFLPIIGMLLVRSIVTPLVYLSFQASAPLWAQFSYAGTLLLEFGWQLGTLVRAGSGFELFPTGLWPALRRSGRVFLPVAVSFWLLDGRAWRALGLLSEMAQRVSRGLTVESEDFKFLVLAYLVPLAFLLWRQEEFDRRSRKLIKVVSAVYLGFWIGGSFLGPFFFPRYPMLTLADVSGLPAVLVSAGILTVWQVYTPLCLFRWWVRDRFWRPLVVTSLAYGLGTVPIMFRWSDAFGSGSLTSLLGLVSGFLVVTAVLFRSAPVGMAERRNGP